MDPLHPQTVETLRQLVKLHGAPRLIEAIREIASPVPPRDPRVANWHPDVRRFSRDMCLEAFRQGPQTCRPARTSALSLGDLQTALRQALTNPAMVETVKQVQTTADRARMLGVPFRKYA